MKLIAINCFGRGGSNLIWNVIGSSPQVAQTRGEFHDEIFRNRWDRRLWRAAVGLPLARQIAGRTLCPAIRRALEVSAHTSARSLPNAEKMPGVRYTEYELPKLAVTVKLMQDDIQFNGILRECFEETRFVALVRDPVAQIEGWKRRGLSVKQGIENYRKVALRMLAERGRADYLIVRFEDFLNEPFKVAERMWSFCGVSHQPGERIRIKVKKTLVGSGKHVASGGAENTKVWIDRHNVHDFIRRDINDVQKLQLRDQEVAFIRQRLGPIVQELGY